MIKIDSIDERTEVLDQLIIQVRFILNELCANSQEIQNTTEKLILSRCLDELIVESVKLQATRRLSS